MYSTYLIIKGSAEARNFTSPFSWFFLLLSRERDSCINSSKGTVWHSACRDFFVWVSISFLRIGLYKKYFVKAMFYNKYTTKNVMYVRESY